jgi:3-oxoacyl-[acyl-carrier protein] reductase
VGSGGHRWRDRHRLRCGSPFRAEPAGLQELAASWRANFDANLVSAVLMTALIAERLSRGGSVISVGSIAADKGAGS